MIAMYSWWQLGEVECVPNSKPAKVEVGHAHGYIICSPYGNCLVRILAYWNVLALKADLRHCGR